MRRALALVGQLDGVSRAHLERLDDQGIDAAGGFPVDLGDDVAGPETGIVCRTARGYGFDERPVDVPIACASS